MKAFTGNGRLCRRSDRCRVGRHETVSQPGQLQVEALNDAPDVWAGMRNEGHKHGAVVLSEQLSG